MSIEIIKNLLPRICEHAQNNKTGKELCGVITKQPAEVLFLDNIAVNDDDFVINKNDIVHYLINDNILCIWHTHKKDTHPDLLTISDINLARILNVPILMRHEITDRVDYYEPKNPNPFPNLNTNKDFSKIDAYLGWDSNEFLWGRTDCFEVIRCYFLGIHGIDIGNFQRPTYEGFPAPEWVCPWIAEKHGFTIAEDIQNEDILEIVIHGGRVPSHLAVVVDARQGIILHQPGSGHLSQFSRLGNYWRDRIAIGQNNKHRILRHKKFVCSQQ